MLWLVSLVPVLAGASLGVAAPRRRLALGAGAGAALAATVGLALWGALGRASASLDWGAGLVLRLAVDDPSAVMMVLVPAVALVVAVYAAAHEEERGLARLVGTLVAFTGAMELLVLAADVLTLLVAWELVGACSWALIGHQWWRAGTTGAATQAFVATRVGDLGLFAAAGAALAGTGSFDYRSLAGLDGGWLHVLVAGVVLAAVAKSALLPFSPWLFSAMAGPTSVSALLHAATMVAAGAFILVRLHPVLDQVAWFAPVVMGVGVATALAGGVVALVQRHAKKLLAASTSAQYGLMFVAVGAGVPAAALAHLVAHAAFKAGLFLSAGIAMEAVESPLLDRMRLGRRLPVVAGATIVVALALAAVPPLGGAWTKEQVLAAAGHAAPAAGVAVAVAGALSAFYAARLWLLAFGRPVEGGDPALRRRPSPAEVAAVVVLALASGLFGLAWVPGAGAVVGRLAGAELVPGTTWELALSLALVATALYAASVAHRRGTLVTLGRGSLAEAVAPWFRLSSLSQAVVVDPTLRLAGALVRFDDRVLDVPARAAQKVATTVAAGLAGADRRVVDAGVRGVAAVAAWAAGVMDRVSERGFDGAVRRLAGLVGAAGADVRRTQTGMTHHYYVVVAAGTGALVLVTLLWR